jgi:hypothetical protein
MRHGAVRSVYFPPTGEGLCRWIHKPDTTFQIHDDDGIPDCSHRSSKEGIADL